jgi:hypothetical protein
VDGRDFLVWQRTLGATVTPGTGADGDNNGSIGAGDLTVWRTNFGLTGASAAATSIPEPNCVMLMGLAIVAAAGRRHRIRIEL